ncbi:site-specific integrase [Paraburkholderia nemoris]|uniref:tyrosine-type recombinase/integrase n=1 Tax=Paraburkholderia nemoris TaxID=2793076 RepID=UPI0038BC9E7C
MAERYRIETSVFASGERFPFLVCADTGIPLFDPTVFALTEYRTRNRASGTIEQMLRDLTVLLMFCNAHQIDLHARMLDGRLLDLGELDALVRMCRLPLSVIEFESRVDVSASESNRAVVSLQSYKARSKNKHQEISGESASVRIRYIQKYLGWLVDRRVLTLSAKHPARLPLVQAKDIVVSGLIARSPAGRGRNKVGRRKALDETAQERLWQIVAVDSPENPWEGRHAKVRNELIVRWFMGLGIRRGELLGLKIPDLNFRSNEAFIARRADDPTDPRVYQPNAKTLDRLLPMSDDLARRTKAYILQERRKYGKARAHAFLFVANGGAPLSLRGLNKIFDVLRGKHREFEELFPHLMRHTTNFNFSKIADEQGMDREKELKARSHMMGWSETSNTAATYTQRETERKAREASLQLQNKMVKPINDSQ